MFWVSSHIHNAELHKSGLCTTLAYYTGLSSLKFTALSQECIENTFVTQEQDSLQTLLGGFHENHLNFNFFLSFCTKNYCFWHMQCCSKDVLLFPVNKKLFVTIFFLSREKRINFIIFMLHGLPSVVSMRLLVILTPTNSKPV